MSWNGRTIPIDQTNNSYVFPGMGLGILAANARRVSDAMFMVAAKAIAQSPQAITEGRLLPRVSALRSVAFSVARAVARQAQADGVADLCAPEVLDARIKSYVWEPRYRNYATS